MKVLLVFLCSLVISGCVSGMGQQSLYGASMDWRTSNSVPANLVGKTLRNH